MKVQTEVTNPASGFSKFWKLVFQGPAKSDRTELLDLPGNSASDLAHCFKDLRRINRFLGGVGPVKRALQPFLPPLEEQKEITLLDLASGMADVPLALANNWIKQGYKVNLTCVDLNPGHVELSQQAALAQQAKVGQSLKFQALSLDIFSDNLLNLGQFDFVTCSLAFHHLSAEQQLAALKIMAQQSRKAFLVNDLKRGWFGYLGAHFLGLTFTRSRLVRHDAPLSVLRSFTKGEMKEMAQSARLPSDIKWRIKPALFSRLLLVGAHA
jgi:SAM-dependent methyltransferase